MCGNRVVALVVTKSESEICLDRIKPAILQGIGTDLVEKPDPATFLAEVENEPLSELTDTFEGRFELIASIAANRAQCIPSKTL